MLISTLSSSGSSVLATGVAPELNIITIAAAVVLFAVAIWFLVIAEDLKTSFRRFRKLDLREQERDRGRDRARSS